MYSEVTKSIKISVDPTFMEDQSEPEDFHFVWAYHIRIENQGDDTVQLLRRHWHITDSQGRIHEVRGEGVVGEQPVLAPGESFEYTSVTPLASLEDTVYRKSLPRYTAYRLIIPSVSELTISSSDQTITRNDY